MPFADAVFNIFTGVWCYELYLMCSQWCSPKRRCSFVVSVFVTNYVCVVLYGIMLNLDAIIISVCMVLCETSMLLFVFRIGHFRVPLSLCFKASLSAKLFSWKWHWFAWNWNCMPNWFSYEIFSTRTRYETEQTRTRLISIMWRCRVWIKKKMSLFYDSFNIATKLAKLIDKSAITNSDNFFPKRTRMASHL